VNFQQSISHYVFLMNGHILILSAYKVIYLLQHINTHSNLIFKQFLVCIAVFELCVVVQFQGAVLYLFKSKRDSIAIDPIETFTQSSPGESNAWRVDSSPTKCIHNFIKQNVNYFLKKKPRYETCLT